MTPTEVRALRGASEKAAQWTTTRDNLIREAHASGASLREIASATGNLTHSAIARIVKR